MSCNIFRASYDSFLKHNFKHIVGYQYFFWYGILQFFCHCIQFRSALTEIRKDYCFINDYRLAKKTGTLRKCHISLLSMHCGFTCSSWLWWILSYFCCGVSTTWFTASKLCAM